MSTEKANRPHFDKLVDSMTGEVATLEPGTKIVPPRHFAGKPHNHAMRYVTGTFLKIHDTAIPILFESHLSKTQLSVLLLLCQNTRSQTQNVSLKNGRPVSIAWIASEIGETESSAQQAVYALNHRGIVKYNRTTKGRAQLVMNPFVFQRGKQVPLAAMAMFKDTEYYKAWEAKFNAPLPDWFWSNK